MTQFNAIQTRVSEIDLTVQQEADIAALIADVFNADFEGRSFFQQRHTDRYLFRDREQLLCHVATVFRAVRLGDMLVDIVGVAEVVTAKHARKQGLASGLIKQIIDEAQTSKTAFILLFGVEVLYRRLGFKPVANPLTYVDLSKCRTQAIVATDDHALMVLQTGDMEWDQGAPIDFLGPLF